MSDILIDNTTGDISIVGCSPVITSNLKELVSQRLHIRLNTFLGEWFYNINVGVPYFEEIITKRYDRGIVEGILKRVILATENVVSITKFESSFNPSTRNYNTTYSVEITSDDGNPPHTTDTPLLDGNIIDNLSNSIVLSGGYNLAYHTTNPNLQC